MTTKMGDKYSFSWGVVNKEGTIDRFARQGNEVVDVHSTYA